MKKSFLKKMFLGVAAVTSIALLGACGNGSKDSGSSDSGATKTEDAKGALKIWTTSNALKQSAESWGEKEKQEVEVVVIPYADFQTKLKQQVSDASTAPDVFIVSRDFVKDWSDKKGVIVDLEKQFPEDIKTYKENTYSDLLDFGSNPDGNIVTVTGEYPVGMMFYNRTVAKDILGTDDPEEVSKAMDSSEKWSDVNKKIQEKYGDSVKLFATVFDTQNVLFQQREKPFVKDGVFTIDDTIVNFFDETKKLYDDKMFLSEIESESSQAALNTNGFFVNFLPSWGFASKIRPTIEGKEGEGNFGIAKPTYTYARGGSYFFITESSKHKNAAWEYIKSQSVDVDALVSDQQAKVGYPSNKEAAEKLKDSGYEEPLLGNQKVYDIYSEQASIQEKATKNVVTKYDGSIQQIIVDLLTAYGTGSISKDDALKELGDKVLNAYPDLEIKEDY